MAKKPMTLEKWEKSAADKKADKMAVEKINKKESKVKGKK